MKKKIALITGIAGQDGSYLSEFLLKKNYKVYGILPRRSNPEFQTYRIEKILNKINLCYGDILDKLTLDDLLKKIKPNEIYHLAAQSHVGVSFKSPFITTQIDYVGVINILDSIRINSPNSKFYNASTSEIYGNINKNNFINERSEKDPVSPYGISKLAAYYLTKVYRDSYGLFTCNGILFNHESPRRGLNFVTAKIVKGALEIKYKKKKFIELGYLDSNRDWGHAKDYVKAMWLMLQRNKADDYVIATGISKSVRDVCKLVFKKLNLGDYKKYIKINKRYLRPNELYHLRGDAKKAKKILKWKPEISFEAMLDEMILELDKRFFPKK
tara:strand:+ start:20291 stop:21274 length:984 start_codon:yes stop_codon:yes gene_type:complete